MRTLMRFWAVTAAASALIALALGSAAATPGDHPYVALGDSVTVGWRSTAGNSFVDSLFSDYGASLGADQILNRAQPGASGASLRNGGQLTTALADINAPSDTVAVTLGIGGYDALLATSCPGHWDDSSVCTLPADFAYITTQLQIALDGDPGSEPFTVLAYYNPQSGTGGAQETSVDHALLGNNLKVGCADAGSNLGLNDVIYQEAGELGLPVADAYPAIKQAGQADIDPDHLHPNNAGHAAIAEAFRDATKLCGDTDPPQTRLLSGPHAKTTKTFTTFKFRSDEAGSTFRCRLDNRPASPCRTKTTYRHLARGRHAFRVAATDAAGNSDSTPALKRWRVLAKV